MRGFVDDDLQPKIKIKVKGLRRSIEIEGVVDTGFSGDLCLPIPIATQLGLELSGKELVELADGSIKKELLFEGTVIWRNKKISAEISLTDFKDALI